MSNEVSLSLLVKIFGLKLVRLGLRKRDRYFIENTQNFNEWALDFIRQRIEIETLNIEEKGDAFEPRNIIEAILFENYKCRKNGK